MHDLHESEPSCTPSRASAAESTLDRSYMASFLVLEFRVDQDDHYGMRACGACVRRYVSPGYLGFMSSNHNGMLRMYETFGNGANP